MAQYNTQPYPPAASGPGPAQPYPGSYQQSGPPPPQPYPPAAPGPAQPYPGGYQQGGPPPPSGYQQGQPQGQPQGAGGEPENFQLPPDVTVDKLRMGDGDNAVFMPTAPPVDTVQGYGNVTFQDAMLPPPAYDAAVYSIEPPNRPTFSGVSVITDSEARNALIQHCGKHCCYGKGAATDMVIAKMQSTSAFHYILESFGEGRSTAWAHTPYRGGPVDGPMNGQPPLPWDIPLYASEKYKTERKQVEVPHTAYVKTCEKCFGIGRLRCHHCCGCGHTDCTSCSGGYTMVGNERRQCTWCNGAGRRQCTWCHGRGHLQCSMCLGCRQLKWFIQLTVNWTNHLEDYILERTAMPDEKIRKVQGQIVFEEDLPWVYPVTQCPEPTVNKASADLVAKHRVQFTSERILLQRQRIRIVPVTEVNANWKDKNFTFFVYGLEHKVYSDNYPQTCCCGCSIL